ncbi:MAG: hypothetical protein AVDCRST_MAG54-2213, partial [uncultured Actinomycetospora sp.]
ELHPGLDQPRDHPVHAGHAGHPRHRRRPVVQRLPAHLVGARRARAALLHRHPRRGLVAGLHLPRRHGL